MLQVKAVYVCNKILDFEGTLYNSVVHNVLMSYLQLKPLQTKKGQTIF